MENSISQEFRALNLTFKFTTYAIITCHITFLSINYYVAYFLLFCFPNLNIEKMSIQLNLPLNSGMRGLQTSG